MKIIVLAFGGSLFAKPIHVKLADKGCKIRVLEIDGQDIISKFFNIIYNEAYAIMMPLNDI